MKNAMLGLALVALVASSNAQESLKKRTVTPVPGAVTQTEAATTFARVERAFFRTTRINRSLPTMARSDKAATRTEILARMVRLVDELKGEFKFAPKRIVFDPATLTVKGITQAQVERLVSWGFVAKTSPLVSGTQETLKPAEFGDAMGLFIARLADLTHTPSSKWSPYMSGG